MSYPILVCLDIDEMGGTLKEGQMTWLNDPNRIDRAIRDLSMNWPNATVCIYGLNELQKLKTQPTYQRYKVTNKGETIPV